MKYIMHDWSDADCRTILGHIRDASTHGYSKLIIEDFIMPDTDAPLLATLWDLEMLIYLNSMERTKSQWTALLFSAGLRCSAFRLFHTMALALLKQRSAARKSSVILLF